MNHLDISNNPDSDNHSELSSIGKKGPWLVLLHANWCPHCRNMDEDWVNMTNSNPRFNTAKIESELVNNAPKVISNLPVQGFPTMVMIKDGKKVAEYSGDRSPEDMLNFGNKHCSGRRMQSGGRRSLKKLSRRANKRSLKNRRTRRGGGGLTTSMELGLERLDNLIGNLHNHNHNNRI